MQKEAVEPTGFIPRSIIRTFDRFLQQLLPGSENVAIQEYKVSRYQILVSIQSLCLLVCIPFFVNYTVKSFLFTPLIEHFWNSQQDQIFLNSYQEKRAFQEMQDFSDKIFFESLLQDKQADSVRNDAFKPGFPGIKFHKNSEAFVGPKVQECQFSTTSGPACFTACFASQAKQARQVGLPTCVPTAQGKTRLVVKQNDQLINYGQSESTHSLSPKLLQEQIHFQRIFQFKSFEIADKYNKQSILALTNIFTDLLTSFTLYLLFVTMRPQIVILRSFLTESLYSLSDTTKSFLLILVMDLLVGFHSPRGWEIALEASLRHFGLPENEQFVLLFVALFPVILDTLFKYWIFRFLNKISPSTVVTYHSMLE